MSGAVAPPGGAGGGGAHENVKAGEAGGRSGWGAKAPEAPPPTLASPPVEDGPAAEARQDAQPRVWPHRERMSDALEHGDVGRAVAVEAAPRQVDAVPPRPFLGYPHLPPAVAEGQERLAGEAPVAGLVPLEERVVEPELLQRHLCRVLRAGGEQHQPVPHPAVAVQHGPRPGREERAHLLAPPGPGLGPDGVLRYPTQGGERDAQRGLHGEDADPVAAQHRRGEQELPVADPSQAPLAPEPQPRRGDGEESAVQIEEGGGAVHALISCRSSEPPQGSASRRAERRRRSRDPDEAGQPPPRPPPPP